MNTPDILATLMKLPEAERFEIAMTVLDCSSPSAMAENEIRKDAAHRQDELESGVVRDISYEELLAGIAYRPTSNP
ncbi:MAG: hypothetical protein K9N23_04485 [Akkermansiaceae bacterium]|nr:hypothetical protein [Akkermansiaceae bacterium]MCF7730918.1 hypothetical protein [Akkermansiaceae bacterium]